MTLTQPPRPSTCAFVRRALPSLFLWCGLLAVWVTPCWATAPAQNEPGEVLPLRRALQLLAEQTGIGVVFADDLVDGVSVQAEIDGKDVEHSLRRLLAGTHLDFVRRTPDRLILFRKEGVATRRVAGVIRDKLTGLALADAQLAFAETTLAATADGNGAFALKQVPVAVTRAKVTAPGYFDLPVRLSADQGDQELVLSLERRTEVREVVQVFRGRGNALAISALSGSMSLSPDQVGDGSHPSKDLFASLSLIPGVESGLGDSGVGVRGGRPSENLVLLDGMPLYQIDHAIGYFSSLNADAIESIEIYKGGFPATYGGRVTGVLDLTVKGEGVDSFEFYAGVNEDLAHLTVATPLGSRASMLVSTRRSVADRTTRDIYARVFEGTFNDEILEEEFDESGYRSERSLDFDDTIAKLFWRPTGKDKISITYYEGADGISEGVSFDLPEGKFPLYGKDGEWGNQATTVHWRHDWHGRAATEVRWLWSDFHSDFAYDDLPSGAQFEYDEDGNLVLARPLRSETNNYLKDRTFTLTHHWSPNDKHQIELGLGLSQLEQAFIQRSTDFGYDFRDSVKTDTDAFYIQDRWQPLPQLALLLGWRREHNTLTGSDHDQPRISWNIELNRHWSLRGRFGRYHQFALRSPDTFNYFEGYPTWFLAEEDWVRVIRSDHFSLAAHYEQPTWLVDLEWYQRYSHGNIQRLFNPEVGLRARPAQTRDRVRGLDALFQYKRGRFSGWLGYGYMDAQVLRDVVTGAVLDHPSDVERPHSWKLSAQYAVNLWRFASNWRYASGQPYDLPQMIGPIIDDDGETEFILIPSETTNNLRLPATHQLDLLLARKVTLGGYVGELGLSLANIYDRRNVLYRYHQNEGAELIPIDVVGFGFRPSMYLQLRF